MRTRRTLISTAVAAALILAASEASALDLTFTGGMGLTVWPMNIQVTELDHSGVGVGISGRVMMRLGNHLRFQAGLLQGTFTLDDRSRVKRSGIFGSVEAFQHLNDPFYASLGLKVAADHLRLTETLELFDDGTRHVNDVNRWTPLIEPFLTLGVLLGGRFHLEFETGVIVAFFDGEVYLSVAAVIGVYFLMGGRH